MAGRRTTTVKPNRKWVANMCALGPSKVKASELCELRVEMLDSMEDVRRDAMDAHEFRGRRKGHESKAHEHIDRYLVNGRQGLANRAVEQSEPLIADALAIEPRLARRPQWERSDDGIFADPALVASGDDSPCYQMVRRSLRDASNTLEPVTVVVSTDSSTPDAGRLAAFVATIRIVQQFRPVHVYWQGAWLNPENSQYGYVFYAPVITGDMDFGRLAYIAADVTRDWASHGVLHQRAYVRDRVSDIAGLGGRGERSYLPKSHYVDHNGIPANGRQVANRACVWLGMAAVWEREYNAEQDAQAALQSLPEERTGGGGVSDAEREAAELRWQRYQADERKRKAEEARRRMGNI